jgi:sugar phosphate isomerase/epimerase
MQWLRLYSEARVDRKLQSLTDAQFRVWFNLLCFANEQEDRGRFMYDDPDLLAVEVAGGDSDLLEFTIDRLEKLKILSRDAESMGFRNFEKRQYDKPSDHPDRVAERVRRHRETKKSQDVTPCNAPYTDTDTERDSATALKRVRVRAIEYTPEFEAFWAAYPPGAGSKKVTFQRWKELHPDPVLIEEIMTGLEAWHRSDRWQRKFIKAAEIWIRDRYWENPPPEAVADRYRNLVA